MQTRSCRAVSRKEGKCQSDIENEANSITQVAMLMRVVSCVANKPSVAPTPMFSLALVRLLVLFTCPFVVKSHYGLSLTVLLIFSSPSHVMVGHASLYYLVTYCTHREDQSTFQ